MQVAVTGSTGAVGGGVCAALARAGVDAVLISRSGERAWDLSQPVPAEVQRSLANVDAVIHCAADIRIGGLDGDRQAVNVGGVQALVDALCSVPNPPVLVHVSSAFASVNGRDANNGYELSKADAERVVANSGLDARIVRPSLVIGRVADGEISRFSGLFVFLRMLRAGLVPALPGDDQVRVDIVPVDVVAKVILEAIEAAPSGAPRYATSGSSSPRLHQIVDVAFEEFRKHDHVGAPPPKIISPDTYHRLFRPNLLPELSPAQRVLLDTIEVFLPYFEHEYTFEDIAGQGSDELLDTWRLSVRFWLQNSERVVARGEQVWSRRST